MDKYKIPSNKYKKNIDFAIIKKYVCSNNIEL